MLFIICLIVILTIMIFKFEIIVACGDSMLPTVNSGDYLLVYKTKRIKLNDIYVIDLNLYNQYHNLVVKRLITSTKDGKLIWIEGDNKDNSFDSRKFGYIPSKFIVGRVITIWKTKKK